MNQLYRQIISILLSIFLVGLIYYGSLLPFHKASIYIRARQTEVNDIKQFNDLYDGILSTNSPVGQDELVSNYLDLISSLINQEKGKEKPNLEIIKYLASNAEKWAEPIIERGTGFSFSQIIYNYATINRDVALVLNDKKHYDKAVTLYQLGLKHSPDRQIFLYTLFDLYVLVGDKAGANLLGDRIIEVYDDNRVTEIISKMK